MKMNEKLMALRKRQGLSQEDLADKLRVARQTISKWEQGLAAPSTENVRSLMLLYQVSADYLLNDEVEEERPEESPQQPQQVNLVQLVGPDRKKHNGWKYAFFVLLAINLLAGIWLGWCFQHNVFMNQTTGKEATVPTGSYFHLTWP